MPMQQIVHRLIRAIYTVARLLGLTLFVTLVTAAIVALRHLLETPQQLESLLPGEAHFYHWKQGYIFYKLLGAVDAPALVLLHAPEVGASAYEMRKIMAPLAQYYRVYALDLLGFGLSDRPTIDYSAETYRTLCRDFLTEVVARPATIVASRESCNYAIAVAASSPRFCEALVLISPVALHNVEGEVVSGMWGEDPWVVLRLRVRSCLQRARSAFLQVPIIKTLLYALLSTRFALRYMQRGQHPLRTTADLDYLYAATHQFGAQHAPMALLAGKLSQDTSEESESQKGQKGQQPTLIIWGAEALKYITSQHDIAAHTQLRLLRDAGISVHEEHPEGVVATIRQWREEGKHVTASEVPEDSTPIRPASPLPLEREGLIRAPLRFAEGPNDTRAANDVGADQSLERGPGDHVAGAINQPLRPQAGRKEEAYCVKCKRKTEVVNAHEVTMKNGRVAVRGTCAVCGTGLFRIGRLVTDNEV